MTIVGEDKTQGGHNVSQRQCFVWELAETGFCRVSHGKETAIYVNNVKGFSRRRAPPSFEVLKVVHVTTRYYTLLREEEEEEGEQQEEAAEWDVHQHVPPTSTDELSLMSLTERLRRGGGGGGGGMEIDFVMCCGHFLGRDEEIFDYIDRCSTAAAAASTGKHKGSGSAGADGKGHKGGKGGGGGGSGGAVHAGGGVSGGKGKGVLVGLDHMVESNGKGKTTGTGDNPGKPSSTVTTFGYPITCTVGRKRSGAAYYVNDSDDIAELLATLTNSLDDGKGRVELLQFDADSSLGSSRSLADLARQGSVVNMANVNMSRPGSLVDVARMQNRNQSMSNISDNSSVDAACGGRADERPISA
eukprot:CAMPEP_0197579166 /NCGR_PEP_ID=MMETSP1326-20131121/3221_1 /TAXON_ID=1155430 /ORGANISM="Genus nov. species nov., Strain RCC2288" /LENGTH=357 /DNA_ID=CAMNT_0043142545 /DNA_START=26 /DNA_END=1098 /DNA_ORIENTATION=+